MVEPNALAVLLDAIAPSAALLFGLLIGCTIIFIYRTVPRASWLIGRQVQSLHVELGRVEGGQDEPGDASGVVVGFAPGPQDHPHKATLRWWQIDEVVEDESMGTN
jgi:hypothetical protein